MDAESQASELPLSDEQKKQLALAAAHDEDISACRHAIAHWLQHSERKTVSLLQLQQVLGLSLIKLWLGLLVGEQKQYQWESSGNFYHEARELFLVASSRLLHEVTP